jgi:dTDP-4-dehydrorhamnose reductase
MSGTKERVLIHGITGMLGHTLFLELSKHKDLEVFGTARHPDFNRWPVFKDYENNLRPDVEADNFDSISRSLAAIQPTLVINCIGLIKQIWWGTDPLAAITVNAQLPHRISLVCKAARARLIHIGTDCVFNGKAGNYADDSPSTAEDIYGKSKSLGEVAYPHCVTLRTSIIGHELKGHHGVVDWFLRQKGTVKGYARAIFTGFPTVELSRIISDYVIPNRSLSGVYNVSAEPCSKYRLLQLVKERYGLDVEVVPTDEVIIDRSLDSTRFRSLTGYRPPAWEALVERMHADYVKKKEAFQCYF